MYNVYQDINLGQYVGNDFDFFFVLLIFKEYDWNIFQL